MSSYGLSIPPYIRLILLIAIGLAAFLIATWLGIQPPSGPTWDASLWLSLWDVPGTLWVSIVTGFLAYLISSWVWALKPNHIPAILFAASGLMTLGFCYSSIAYDLAFPVPDDSFALAARVNMLTASGFGIIMPCLFALYPSRLPGWPVVIAASVLGFGGWTLFAIFGPNPNYDSVQHITFYEMLAIVAVVIWQVWDSRKEPRRYAIAIWLGVSTILGSGGFIATVAAPITFGFYPLIEPNYAFAFFLIIYFGLAIGLLRYRLFDLGTWAYQLAFYVSAALLMILLDLALVSVMALDQGQAIGVSLLVIALGYLPFRDLIWRRLMRPKTTSDDEMFHRVLDAALKPSALDRAASWEALLTDRFRPLQAVPITPTGEAAHIDTEGLSLYIPPVGEASALLLQYPGNGRTLFSPSDVALARHLTSMLQYAKESRDAYDRGVTEERTRIARDIHDNIGAQLMRALHSERQERKDTMIRETLADLRDVINNAQSPVLPLDDMLADLRAETADRLEPHGINLIWTLETTTEVPLSPSYIHAIRSFVREAASNAIKHSGATEFSVMIDVNADQLNIHLRDNGRGYDVETITLGQGLGNMKSRMEGLHGSLSMTSDGSGTVLSANLPMGDTPS
ncbi:MAG: histidine kinase [Ponticaulis sp.]|nr:histidine kinase [Ponticaulis sp.]